MKIKILLASLVLALSVSAHAATRPEASKTGPSSVDRVISGTMTWTDDLDVLKDSWTCTPRVQITGHDGKVAAQEVVASTITGHLKVTGDVTWTQTSALDWSAGSGMNVDTTTYPGSVAINASTYTHTNQLSKDAIVSPHNGTYSALYQKIVATDNLSIKSIVLYADNGIAEMLSTGTVKIVTTQPTTPTDAFVSVGTATFSCTLNYGTPFIYVNTDFDNVVNLSAGSTYYLLFTDFTGGVEFAASSDLTKGTSSYCWVSVSSTWTGTSYTLFYALYDIHMTASFTSQFLSIDSLNSLDSILISSSIPPNSSMSFYAQISTSSSNLSTRPGIPLISGTSLAGHPGPYIQLVSSFSRTTAASVPKLDAFSLDYTVAKWLAGEEIAGDRNGYAVGVTTPAYRKEWFIDDNFDLWVGTGTDNAWQWIKK